MAKLEKIMRADGTDPFRGVDMKAIKIGPRGCRDSEKSLEAGKTYEVPGQVSLSDAKTLVLINKAEVVGAVPPVPGVMTTANTGALVKGKKKKAK